MLPCPVGLVLLSFANGRVLFSFQSYISHGSTSLAYRPSFSTNGSMPLKFRVRPSLLTAGVLSRYSMNSRKLSRIGDGQSSLGSQGSFSSTLHRVKRRFRRVAGYIQLQNLALVVCNGEEAGYEDSPKFFDGSKLAPHPVNILRLFWYEETCDE